MRRAFGAGGRAAKAGALPLVSSVGTYRIRLQLVLTSVAVTREDTWVHLGPTVVQTSSENATARRYGRNLGPIRVQ